MQTQIKKHEIINCLKVFGLQPDDIKKAQDDLKKYNGALLAVLVAYLLPAFCCLIFLYCCQQQCLAH
jgi:hypothetical protein